MKGVDVKFVGWQETNRMGLISTGRLVDRLGIVGSLSPSWIELELGVKPELKAKTGTYWTPKHVPLIKEALARHLSDGAEGQPSEEQRMEDSLILEQVVSEMAIWLRCAIADLDNPREKHRIARLISDVLAVMDRIRGVPQP